MPKKDSIEEQRKSRTPGSEYPRASEKIGDPQESKEGIQSLIENAVN